MTPTTSNEAELRAELHELESRLETTRKDRTAAEETSAACDREMNRLGVVQSQVNQDCVSRNATYQALKIRLANTRIDATSTDDIAAAAHELRVCGEQVEFCVAVLEQVTKTRLPAARIASLTAKVEVAATLANITALESKLHSAEVCLAAGPVARLEGSVLVKGQKSEYLARLENQSQQALEQARRSLEAEIALQERIKGRTSGPIGYVNP